jgi:L-ribulokinase
MAYTIGLDYGTNSVRCLIVNVANGDEPGTAVYEYPTGEASLLMPLTTIWQGRTLPTI